VADPAHLRALVGRASMHELAGRKQEAIADYRRALAIDPSHAEAATGLRRLGAAR
jgi:predicted TPR repeat methyltransferase